MTDNIEQEFIIPTYVAEYRGQYITPVKEAYEAAPAIELAKQYDNSLEKYVRMMNDSPHKPHREGIFIGFTDFDFKLKDGVAAEIRWANAERMKLSELLQD